jgi:hypothetical protein
LKCPIEGNQHETRFASRGSSGSKKERNTTTMMNVFSGIVKKMTDGGGVSFDIDSRQGDGEALATTLERRDNEEGDGDGDGDEEEE